MKIGDYWLSTILKALGLGAIVLFLVWAIAVAVAFALFALLATGSPD